MKVKILKEADLEATTEAEMVIIDTGTRYMGQTLYIASTGERTWDLRRVKRFAYDMSQRFKGML